MSTIYKLLFFLSLCLMIACVEDTSTNGKPTKTDDKTSVVGSKSDKTNGDKPIAAINGKTDSKTIAEELPKQHDCTIKGNVLEDNMYWVRSLQTLVCIVADSTTKDEEFGDSHRILEVYDTKNCKLIERKTLPVNISPDYHYYLDSNSYDNKNNIIAIPGMDFVFCYDVKNRKLLDRLQAKYLNNREAIDAQSGMPMGTKTWGNYLLGYAKDFGAYAFELGNDKTNPVLPVAEYLNRETAIYNSLFLLNNGDGSYMAAIPTLDEDQFQMELKELFQSPQKIVPQVDKKVRNNRFIILKTNSTPEKRIAIDMKQMKQVALSKEVEILNTKAILDWLKKNVK